MKQLKFSLVFSALIVLSISNAYAQPATKPPFLKYLINNYSSLHQAIDSTSEPVVGKPLQRYRPIPLPLAAAADALPGVNVNYIPGLSAPNFLLGGSPEIKGLVQEVGGTGYSKTIGKNELLFFKSGAQGVAVSKTGKIFTSSLTVPPGPTRTESNPKTFNGFFSFNSAAAILPTFNDRSNELFVKSPEKVFFEGVEIDNNDLEIAYFAIHPENENIVYAAFENSEAGTKILARKNRAGDWLQLEWGTPEEPKEGVWGALAVDKDGNLYVADPDRHVIVKVVFDDDGKLVTWQIIGGELGTPGFENSDNVLETRFNKPSGICVDKAGNIYIGDAGNNVIRIIESDGDVETYAGNKDGEAGSSDDGVLSSAKFSGPTAVAYNEITEMLYVVDATNKTIREINDSKKVSTLAGHAISLSAEGIFTALYYYLAKLNMNPGEHLFSAPTGVAIDPSGLGLYVSDGNFIKYVNTSEAVFRITAAVGDPKANDIPGFPRLPGGMSLNKNNGAIYGIPFEAWKPTHYTISITNHVTAKYQASLDLVPSGFVTIEVVDCPEKTDTVVINKTIARSQLPYYWNGKKLDSAGTAAVTRPSMFGCDSVTVLNLSLYPELAYKSEPYILGFGQPIKPIVPTTAGSIIETFSVAPTLPAGLALNPLTGVITGTPAVYVPGNPVPAIGPQTPPSYAAPWYLEADKGVDLTEVKISDGNGKVLLENNSKYGMLEGTAGMGTGRAGAYTDYSALAPTKMYSNSPYSVRLANVLASPDEYLLGPHGLYEYNPASKALNDTYTGYNFMNSFAVYIDYNRDGDFDEANEKVYISAGPQSDAHAEVFNLNIPASAKAGVTKMRIYAVEAKTIPWTFTFYDPSRGLVKQTYYVERTTEQALSFYPFFENISNFNNSGPNDFYFNMDYGEFEDYNIEIITPPTQGYVVTGRNAVGSAQSTVRLAVSRASSSTTHITICQAQLPFKWNNLVMTEAGTKTDTLKNMFAADSLATLNLTVNQPSPGTFLTVEHCGPYNFHGQILTESNYYRADLKNVAGCDSLIYLTFRQKANASTTNLLKTPNELPFFWNGIEIRTAGTYTYKQLNKELCDSIATLKVLVQYNITYTTNNLLTLNKTITPINPQIQNNYMPPGAWYNEAYGYSVSPALPAGLRLDPITGIISGTPTALSPLKTYTITLNQEGAQPTIMTLSVGEPSFSTTTIDNCGPLTWNLVKYDKAGTFTATLKNQYGYDSTATLILTIRNLSKSTTDLNLNLSQLPYNWNGDSIRKEGLDTVHFVNSVGCDSAAIANVVISPKINYLSPQVLLHNQPITAIVPQSLGGNVLNYTIMPSLVRGLQFNGATGTITGIPSDTLIRPVTYTITASNRAGTYSTEMVVGVCNPIATSFAKDTCDSFVWNDSTYRATTTHTRILKNRGGCDSTVTMNLTVRKSSKGLTEAVTACGSYTWYNVKYEKTGIYPQVFPNAVGCDSTIYLNLTINPITVTNLYVDLNASDLPYTWRTKTISAPGRDSVMSLNSYGCNGPTWMNVRISEVLPDISYAIKDTILNWEQSITPPIAMTNTGTPVPAMKLGQTDTLMKLSNSGPGDFMRHTVKGPDGAYYAVPIYSSIIYRLNSSKAWTVFADVGDDVTGMAFDTSGNLYVANGTVTREGITKITPAGNQSPVGASAAYWNVNTVSVDADNNLIMIGTSRTTNNLSVSKLNLSTNAVVELQTGSALNNDNRAIKVDSKGNIYVADLNSGRLLKIKPDGRRSTIGSTPLDYNRFQAGNGPDARIPEDITSLAIDPANDNLYLMANGNILRVDTAENVSQITGRQFDAYKDYIVGVESGKVFIINNNTARLYTANVYGVGSFPFMDNYGANGVNNGTVNYTDFDKRIRLDSSGSIVGTPRSTYASAGYRYGSNSSIGYTIVAANEHGISKAPMGITTKGIAYKRESFVTTTLPFTWRGRSYTAATDTAIYYVKNRLEIDDTVYMLHLVYEGPPEPFITSNCVTGGVSLAANGAAKSAISFDGTNWGRIKNVDRGGEGGLAYYNIDWIPGSDGKDIANARTAFEVWIKPESVSGTQYLLTRDSVKTRGTFIGYSIQNGKFVYEFIKGKSPSVDDRVSSVSNIEPNVWTHVAASFYDSALHIYINGKLDNTLQTASRFINPWYSVNDSTFETISPDFYLGGLPGKDGYKGEMDELRLFNTKRNADSVKATMNSILDPKRGGLGLYYRFDGDITDGVMDISASGRRAMLTKPATRVDSSGAPINFATQKWMPGGETTNSIIANPTTNTLYTVTVTDYKKTTGSASLLVYPAQGPSITAPAAVRKTNSPSACTAFISDADLGNATAVDNCPGVMVKRTGVPEGNIFPVGVTIITYTATNASGLTKSATQTVTVTDNQKPVITTNGNQAVNNNKDVCGAAVNVSAAATDNCIVSTPKGVRSDGLALSAVYPVGTTTITWNAADANGNAALPVTQTVTVKDNQKPVITSNGNQVVNNDKDVCGATVKVSATAMDNCSVSAPKGVRSDGLALTAVYPVGTTTITWNVADANGNAALPVTQTVTVTDNQKPVITSNGNQAVNNDKDVCGATVKVSATATDNCSVGAPTGVRSDGLALAAIYPVGTTTITWTVADVKGNVALPVTQTVRVTDNQKPTVLTKDITVTLVNGIASITTAQIDAGSKDNCGINTISVSPSTFKCGNYGNNTVTLTVVDFTGNVGSKTAIVTVKGVAPLPSIVVGRTDNTFTGLDAKTIALGYGAQQLTLSATNTTSAANATTYKWSPATGLSSTNTASTVFKPAAAGTFVFTVTATNEYGCSAATTVTITVVDVRCGTKNDKVLVCNKTGNSSNPTSELCISPNAVAAHLNNGGNLGKCNVTKASTNMGITKKPTASKAEIKGIETELIVSATPNPTTNVFRLRITSHDQNTPATVRVLDAFGRSLNQFDKVAIGSTITFGEGYLNGFYFAEVLQGTQRKVLKLAKGK